LLAATRIYLHKSLLGPQVRASDHHEVADFAGDTTVSLRQRWQRALFSQVWSSDPMARLIAFNVSAPEIAMRAATGMSFSRIVV
jgi:hypothetical protein